MPLPATAPGSWSRGLWYVWLCGVSLTRPAYGAPEPHRWSAAGAAGAEDGQVPDVRHEAVRRVELLEERLQHRGPHRDHVAAAAADHVEVLVTAHRVVGRGAVTQVGVADQAELLEHLEVAVDRRQRELRLVP